MADALTQNRFTPTGRTLPDTECHFGKQDAESSIRVGMFGGRCGFDYTRSGARLTAPANGHVASAVFPAQAGIHYHGVWFDEGPLLGTAAYSGDHAVWVPALRSLRSLGRDDRGDLFSRLRGRLLRREA